MGERLFTSEQLHRFAEDGFLVVRDVVDRGRRDACLRAVNHWLATEFDRSAWETYHHQTFAPPVATSPETLSLLTETPAFELATALVGQPLARPTKGQLALRFPAAPGTEPREPVPHIDGVPTPVNGLPVDGGIVGFSILAGILLSDVEQDDRGNFTVWPGTHVEVASWFAEHGTTFPDPDVVFRANAEIAANASTPVSVRGKAGDLLLAHSLLLHSGGRNIGPDIRYAAYFRLDTEAREALGDSVYTDVWAEWETIRARA